MPNATTGKPFACFECRKTFTRPPVETISEKRVCPHCGAEATMMSHRFRPPKVRESKQWEKVEYLVNHGFFFQKVHRKEGLAWYRVEYPSTLEDAKAFVEEFKDQAWKYDT